MAYSWSVRRMMMAWNVDGRACETCCLSGVKNSDFEAGEGLLQATQKYLRVVNSRGLRQSPDS